VHASLTLKGIEFRIAIGLTGVNSSRTFRGLRAGGWQRIFTFKEDTTVGELGLAFTLRVGRKGYVMLPKAIRESVGMEEGAGSGR